MLRLSLMALIPVALLAGSCGESREEYRDEAAQVACEREQECGRIGDGKDYRTFDDCVVDKTDDFNRTWPSDQCKDDRINEEKFDACMGRLSSIACEGFTRLADAAAFANECNADKVCTD